MSIDLTFVERAFDNRLDAVAAIGEDFTIQYWNEAMERLTSLPRFRAIGVRLFDLFPEIRTTAAEAVLHKAIAGEGVWCPPPFFAASDRAEAHQYCWFLTSLSSGGQAQGAVMVAYALALRGELGRQVEETEQRFRSMADNAPVLLWMSGKDGMCNFFNDTWLKFTGRSLEEEVGVGWASGVHVEDFERCVTTYMQHFSQRQPFEMEYRLRRFDGAYRWILDRGTPRRAANGQFLGFIGSCVDITERRNVEDSLRRANAELEAFAYSASHDLRSPLRGIGQLASWLEEDLGEDLPAECAEHLLQLRTRVDRMQALLSGLHAYARAGTTEELVTRVDCEALVRECNESLVQNGYSVGVEGSLPTIETVRVALSQVFHNLISNAQTHHDRERGRITVRALDEDPFVRFEVEDDGPGIPDGARERIFEVFSTLRPRYERDTAGVGLALVRKHVLRVGGLISVRNATPRGSVFSFTWPKVWPRAD